MNRLRKEVEFHWRLEPYAGKPARTVLRGEDGSNVIFLLDIYKCTNSLRTRKAKQYPSHYKDNRTATYNKHIAAKEVCADCIGAAKGYAWTNGGEGVVEAIGNDNSITSKYGSNKCPDKGANSMFAYAKDKGMPWGTISTIPEIVGLAVTFSGHVGYYVGNGKVIEFKGFSYGCKETVLSSGKWTHCTVERAGKIFS